MDNFKQASKERLRFNTSKGQLTTEQLWDLSLTDLDTLAVSLQEEHEKSGKKSFLVTKSVKDKKAKLAFDVVLEVLNTEANAATEATEAKEIKEHNNKILQLIVEKQDETLKGKTVKQLEAMLK